MRTITAEEVADALVRCYIGRPASMGDVNRLKETIKSTMVGLGYPANPYYEEWEWADRNDNNSYSFMGVDSAVDCLFRYYEYDWSMGDHYILRDAINEELMKLGVPYSALD